MLPGIKVGPRTWKKILKDFHPQCCEVWFRVDWVDRYKEMFAFLKKEKIPTGLHFWGILPGGISPNFAFPHQDIRKLSLELAEKSIDIASQHEFRYLNIHPGSYRLSRIDFEKEQMFPVSQRKTTPSKGNTVLFENVSTLDEHAKRRGVLFLIETIPSREPTHWRDLVNGRLKTQDIGNVPVSVVEKLAKKGFLVCNDFMHSAADVISDDREFLFSRLFNKSKRLSSQTKLIHVNTMPPPFNGTDGHLGIRRQDFAGDVFPTREQMKKLLSLFLDRKDVWVIPEPFSHHFENTLALEELLEEIGN